MRITSKPPALNAEFQSRPDTWAVFHAKGLTMGRCFGSKSAYRRCHPNCRFYPNANVFTQNLGKVWWGDLDLDPDASKLMAVARRLRCTLYVVQEGHGRFGGAEMDYSRVLRWAVWHTGGARRIRGLAEYCRRHGGTVDDLSAAIGVSRTTLLGPLTPEATWDVWRKIGQLEVMAHAEAIECSKLDSASAVKRS